MHELLYALPSPIGYSSSDHGLSHSQLLWYCIVCTVSSTGTTGQKNPSNSKETVPNATET